MIAIFFFQMFTNSKLVFSESRTYQCTCILCQKEKCIALYDIREDDVLYNVSLLFGDFKPYLRVKCFKISAYISSLNLFFLLFVINIIKIAIKTSWFVLLFVFIEETNQYMQQHTCAINLSYTLHKVTVGLFILELCYFFGLFQDVISVTLHLQIYPYVLVNKNGCTFAGYDLPGTCIYTQKHVHV